MKYIDADRLREEIEKVYKSEIAPWLSGVSATSAIYDYVLPLIDSLKQERPISAEEVLVKDPFDDEQFCRGYRSAKHDLAIKFINYLDEHRPEGKMCLSNGECADIEKAFIEHDWAKILRYAKKYLSPKELIEGDRIIERKVGMHGEPIEIRLDKYAQRARGIFPGDELTIILRTKR